MRINIDSEDLQENEHLSRVSMTRAEGRGETYDMLAVVSFTVIGTLSCGETSCANVLFDSQSHFGSCPMVTV
jgi:hypothetical protein